MLYNVPFDPQHPKCYRTVSEPPTSELAVLEIGHNRPPEGTQRVMKRDRYILHYIVGGRGAFMGQPFGPGQGYMVVPNQLERIDSDEQEAFESYWVMFRGSLAPKMLAACGLPARNGVFTFARAADCAAVIHRYLYGPEPANEEAEAMAMQACLFQLLSLHMEEQVKPAKPQIKEARQIADFLERNYQKKLKIQDVAALFYLSPNYMYTLFKREYGISPQEYLITRRLEKARQLLEYSDEKLSVKAVAVSVGFENPLYFSRSFHQRVGCSPSEYRTRVRARRKESNQ